MTQNKGSFIVILGTHSRDNGVKGVHIIDQELLAKLQAKDPLTISHLVVEFTRPLYRASLGLGFNAEQAEELVQETFVTFADVVHRFAGKSKVKTFLYGIFYNKVREARRELLKAKTLRSFEETMESSGEIDLSHYKIEIDPETALSSKEVVGFVDDALSELGPLQKSVFIMKVVEGQDTKEICKVLDITATNMRQLLSRGKRKIKEHVLLRLEQG